MIAFLMAISISTCGSDLFADDFKSEEELIDETRSAVEKHLKDSDEEKPVYRRKVTAKEDQRPETVDRRPQTGDRRPETTDQRPQTRDRRPETADQRPNPTPIVKKDEIALDVTRVNITQDNGTPSDQQAIGEDIEFVSGIEEPAQVKPLIEPILKKMDVDKIGASPYYETYEGLRLLKYFTVAQRVELYQEPRPVDSYIMDAFAIPKVRANTPWNIESDYRTQITPLFTRAYGTEITMSDPSNKEGQVRYTHDYRELYRNYYPKYIEIKREMWDQNEILFMHSKQLEPIGWYYTSNLGYRYSTMEDKVSNPGVPNEKTYYEIRHTYFGSLSLAPNDKLEWFGQAEYYKSMHVRSYYDNRPDHFLGRTEFRIKSDDMKTMYVPSLSYSKDYFYPLANTYQKYEIQYRVGRDFTKRFSASSTVKYVMGFRDEPDNTGPTYNANIKNPFKDKAYAISLENRFSYNVYDRLYLQAGLDLANGLNLSAFDNWGMLAGLEYYAPGMIRVDFGWRGNHYYNIQDFLSCIYFKFYLFM
ncbi:MAG: hypothetical protein Q8O01_04520 [Candidatus Omnitrophota bacterium]|nr:hypothetical protein [Candidatus Omnitrophota bacterium]